MRQMMSSTALLVLLSGSGWSGPTVHCTTREDQAFQRWVTECSDGSRAVTRYDEQVKPMAHRGHETGGRHSSGKGAIPALRRRRRARLRGRLTMVAGLGLSLVSPSLARTVTCHIYPDAALQRLVMAGARRGRRFQPADPVG
jgi:ferric-dicitrate binding protein FerR (iron transport regulator)